MRQVAKNQSPENFLFGSEMQNQKYYLFCLNFLHDRQDERSQCFLGKDVEKLQQKQCKNKNINICLQLKMKIFDLSNQIIWV